MTTMLAFLPVLYIICVQYNSVLAQLQPFNQQQSSGGNTITTSRQSEERTVRTSYQQPTGAAAAFQAQPALPVMQFNSVPVQPAAARYSMYPSRVNVVVPPPPPPSLLLSDFVVNTPTSSNGNSGNQNFATRNNNQFSTMNTNNNQNFGTRNNNQFSTMNTNNNNQNFAASNQMPGMPQFPPMDNTNQMNGGFGASDDDNNLFGDNTFNTGNNSPFSSKISCFTCRSPMGGKCDAGPNPAECPWVFETTGCFQAQVEYTPVAEGGRPAPPPKGSEVSYGCLNDVSFPYMFVKNHNGFGIGSNECKQFDGVEINSENQSKYRLSGRICTCSSSGCNAPQ